MMSVELIGVFAAFAANIITLIKISFALERRIQLLETVINKIVHPKVTSVENQIEVLKDTLADIKEVKAQIDAVAESTATV